MYKEIIKYLKKDYINKYYKQLSANIGYELILSTKEKSIVYCFVQGNVEVTNNLLIDESEYLINQRNRKINYV